MVIDRRTWTTFCCAALLMVCSGSGLHASCTDTLQGEGRVGAILDARTFRLDDGREVRLAGIEVPEDISARSPDALTSLIGGREVTLHGGDDRPDRYGRQPAFVFAKGSGISVQSACSHAAKRWYREPSPTRHVPAHCSPRKPPRVRQGAAFGPVPLP